MTVDRNGRPENANDTRRNSRPRKPQSLTSRKPATIRKIASKPRNTSGEANIAHRPASTMPSSPNEAIQFENGSGEVLIASRLPALAKCVPAVIVPPINPAATIHAGSTSPSAKAASKAPAGMRMKVWTVSHSESKAGTLSAISSAKAMMPATPMTSGFCSIDKVSGKCR